MTPLQSAAEEYFFRGWIMQNVGAWFRHPIVGLVVALTVSTVRLLRRARQPRPVDPGQHRLSRGRAGIAAWRTGGLEAGIAMHAINNLLAFGTVLTLGGWEEAFVGPTTEGTPAIFLLSVGVHGLALALDLLAGEAGRHRTALSTQAAGRAGLAHTGHSVRLLVTAVGTHAATLVTWIWQVATRTSDASLAGERPADRVEHGPG